MFCATKKFVQTFLSFRREFEEEIDNLHKLINEEQQTLLNRVGLLEEKVRILTMKSSAGVWGLFRTTSPHCYLPNFPFEKEPPQNRDDAVKMGYSFFCEVNDHEIWKKIIQ